MLADPDLTLDETSDGPFPTPGGRKTARLVETPMLHFLGAQVLLLSSLQEMDCGGEKRFDLCSVGGYRGIREGGQHGIGCYADSFLDEMKHGGRGMSRLGVKLCGPSEAALRSHFVLLQ